MRHFNSAERDVFISCVISVGVFAALALVLTLLFGCNTRPATPSVQDEVCAPCPEQVECACENAASASEHTDSPPSPPEKSVRKAPDNTRVVIISVDGMGSSLIWKLPHLDEIRSSGACTFSAVTVLPSVTTVAHASMFTGMEPKKHGVVSGAPRGKIALATWKPYKENVKTIFQIAKENGIESAAFIQKQKLENLLPSAAVDSIMLDRAIRESQIVNMACAEIKNPNGKRLVFIHMKRVDAVGHSKGWVYSDSDSVQVEPIINATKKVDEAIGVLAECIAEGQKLHGAPFALIITADHGGHGKTHGTRLAGDMLIPWIVTGPGVKSGYSINARVMVSDTAPTAAWFLGLEAEFDGKIPKEIFQTR